MALSGTKALLVWSQRATEGYKDVSVTNMQRSWKDGLAFCAILHHYRPDLIDFDSLSKENVHENNKLAFDVAEQELGIPALLDPDDMATMSVPDKLSIMTYLSQYFNYFKNKTPLKDNGEQKGRVATKRPAGESPLQTLPSKQPSMGILCAICNKKVYLVERQVADGKLYHRNCFRCTKCSTTLRPGAYKTTAHPKQLECLEHGDNIWKLRSDIAGRAAKDRKPAAADGGSIWESRPAGGSAAAGSPWEKRAEAKPSPNARAVLRDSVGVASIWEARAGLRSVVDDAGSKGDLRPSQGKPAHPASKPTTVVAAPAAHKPTPAAHKPTPAAHKPTPAAHKPTPAANKPSVPMHPHLLAGKAARERFNSPAAPAATVQNSSQPQQGSVGEKDGGEAAKTEATRQGLLASLAAVKADKPASKEDVLEGGAGQKPAEGEGDSREPSPASSKESPKEDMTSEAQKAEPSDESGNPFSEEPENPFSEEPENPFSEEPENPFSEPAEGPVSEPAEGPVSEPAEGPVSEPAEGPVSEPAGNPLSEPSEAKDEPLVLHNADSQSARDSGHTSSSDIFSVTSLSSISQLGGGSERSSLDADHAAFASGIEAGKRSSGFSRASSSDQEGVTAAHLNLSDSLCVEYHAADDKTEDGPAQVEGEPADAETDEKEENERPGSAPPVVEKDGKAKAGKADPDNYDESLNPFGDFEDAEEQEDDGYKNPFDESDDEDAEEVYDDSLNPFGSGNEEDTPGSPVTQWPPPLPSAGPRPESEPLNNQQSPYRVKSRQDILREMQRDRHTLRTSQKRPAPPRPADGPIRSASVPSRPNALPSQVLPVRARAPSKKSRPAPAPPSDTPPKENGQLAESPRGSFSRPDKPPPPAPTTTTTTTPSPAQCPVPSPRLKKATQANKENESISLPVPAPRKKSLEPPRPEDSEMPVPSPRTRRATQENLDPKKVKPPRPPSSPVKAATPPLQGSRKRAPAPPPVKREVDKHHIDPAVIHSELDRIEQKHRELEVKGIKLEESLRSGMEGHDDNEDLLVEWFALVNEKNQLLRREGELVAQAQMQDLELQQAEIEYELRCLMHKHEHQKTDADVEREERLLEMLVEAVTKRSQVVERLEDDRKREEAEDEDIQNMMEQSGLDKKCTDKKKTKKKKALLGK